MHGQGGTRSRTPLNSNYYELLRKSNSSNYQLLELLRKSNSSELSTPRTTAEVELLELLGSANSRTLRTPRTPGTSELPNSWNSRTPGISELPNSSNSSNSWDERTLELLELLELLSSWSRTPLFPALSFSLCPSRLAWAGPGKKHLKFGNKAHREGRTWVRGDAADML